MRDSVKSERERVRRVIAEFFSGLFVRARHGRAPNANPKGASSADTRAPKGARARGAGRHLVYTVRLL